MNFSDYTALLTQQGNSTRERSVNKLLHDIRELAPTSPSYRSVEINGKPRNLIVNSTLDTTIKGIIAMPGEPLCVGNHVKYCDHDYWVTDASADDGIYAYGKMTACTDVVRFISPYDGSIVEYPTILTNTTKFNTGETPNKRLTLPSGQFSMLLPIDEHTIKLDNGFRFLLDKRKDFPSAYKLTYVDASTYGYDDGLLNIVLLQCALNRKTDNIELMIADYYNTYKKPEDKPSLYFDDDLFVRAGGSTKTITPHYDDAVVLPLSFDISMTDEIKKYVIYSVFDNYIQLSVSDNMALIGSFVKVSVTDAAGQHKADTLIKIKGLI